MKIEGITFEEKNCLVAFIDVLGMKAGIKKDMEGAMKSLWIIAHSLKKMAYGKNVIIRTFSDNYFIAIETDKENTSIYQKDFETIINVVGNLMYRCITMFDVLIRGSITYGKMCLDEDIIIGDALVTAYNIESNVAVYPRIVIDQSALLADMEYKCIRDLTAPVFIDYDSLKCVNGLMFPFKGDELKNILKEKVPLQLESHLKVADASNDIKVKSKILWYINYVRDFYSQN